MGEHWEVGEHWEACSAEQARDTLLAGGMVQAEQRVGGFHYVKWTGLFRWLGGTLDDFVVGHDPGRKFRRWVEDGPKRRFGPTHLGPAPKSPLDTKPALERVKPHIIFDEDPLSDAPEWRDISKEQPGDGDYVLVYGDGSMACRSWVSGAWQDWQGCTTPGLNMSSITHWMPLPEGPENAPTRTINVAGCPLPDPVHPELIVPEPPDVPEGHERWAREADGLFALRELPTVRQSWPTRAVYFEFLDPGGAWRQAATPTAFWHAPLRMLYTVKPGPNWKGQWLEARSAIVRRA